MPARLPSKLRELAARFAEAHPYILGALLEDVRGVLQCLPQARREARADGIKLPRLADYAMILRALDIALFLDDDGASPHYDAFVSRVNETLADRVEDDPLMVAVRHVVDRAGGAWTGTPFELLDAVNGMAPIRRPGEEITRLSTGAPDLLTEVNTAFVPALTRDPKAGWPTTPRGLSTPWRRPKPPCDRPGSGSSARRATGSGSFDSSQRDHRK